MAKDLRPDLQFDPNKFIDVMIKTALLNLAESMTIRQEICEIRALMVSKADSPDGERYEQAFQEQVESSEALVQDNYNGLLLDFYREYGKP